MRTWGRGSNNNDRNNKNKNTLSAYWLADPWDALGVSEREDGPVEGVEEEEEEGDPQFVKSLLVDGGWNRNWGSQPRRISKTILFLTQRKQKKHTIEFGCIKNNNTNS